MKKIFKYSIPVLEKFTLDLPLGPEILRVDDIDGKFWLWAIVDPEATETQTVYFECYKTGQPIETPMEYLKYVGFCKLFIMQELCLYFFVNTAMTAKARQ